MVKPASRPRARNALHGARRVGRADGGRLRKGKLRLAQESVRRETIGDKARVEPARARVEAHSSNGYRLYKGRLMREGATQVITNPRIVLGPRPLAPGPHRRKPLFVLSMARRRRAGARRGGFYALPAARKARGVARPVSVAAVVLGLFAAMAVGSVVTAGV